MCGVGGGLRQKTKLCLFYIMIRPTYNYIYMGINIEKEYIQKGTNPNILRVFGEVFFPYLQK